MKIHRVLCCALSVFALIGCSGCGILHFAIADVDHENEEKMLTALHERYAEGDFSFVTEENGMNQSRFVVHDNINDFDFLVYTGKGSDGGIPPLIEPRWVMKENYEKALQYHSAVKDYHNCRVIESDYYTFTYSSKKEHALYTDYTVLITVNHAAELSEVPEQILSFSEKGVHNICLQCNFDGITNDTPLRCDRFESQDAERPPYLTYFDRYEERYTDEELLALTAEDWNEIYNRGREMFYWLDEEDMYTPLD